MSISAQASQKWLSPKEREALLAGSSVLIDSLFDEYGQVNAWKPDTILSTRLGRHLPRQWCLKYTQLFYKQFGICVVVVAWKLAQPKPLPPTSCAEQMAAWAILEEAKEILQRESQDGSEKESAHAFQAFIQRYFPDTSFLLLFDPSQDGIDTSTTAAIPHQTSLAFENWLCPFPGRTPVVHPYAYDSEHVGRAYTTWLTPREQEALSAGIVILIDEIFDDFALLERMAPEDGVPMTLGWHLPARFHPKCTPLFQKQIIVCILTVAWKLVQSKRLTLSSITEELAAWAIITAAREHIALEYEEEGQEDGEQAAEDAFEDLIEVLFEDEDFLLLFDARYDGIDTSLAGQWLHMTSLAFEDWMTPFTNDPECIAHPYAWRG